MTALVTVEFNSMDPGNLHLFLKFFDVVAPHIPGDLGLLRATGFVGQGNVKRLLLLMMTHL